MTIPEKVAAMRQSSAWILQVGPDHRAAVGPRELLHLADTAETFDVPLAPAHCRQVVYWQDHLLPLIDIARWLGVAPSSDAKKYIGILGYQNKQGDAPRFGALWLASPPLRVTVTDDQACVSPADIRWREIAASCFDDGHGPVPILNVRRLFSLPLNTPSATETAGRPLPANTNNVNPAISFQTAP